MNIIEKYNLLNFTNVFKSRKYFNANSFIVKCTNKVEQISLSITVIQTNNLMR